MTTDDEDDDKQQHKGGGRPRQRHESVRPHDGSDEDRRLAAGSEAVYE